MKDIVDVAVVQFTPEPLNAALNRSRMAGAVREEARRRPTDLVVFPELATTGYVPLSLTEPDPQRLARESDTIPGPTTDLLAEAAKEAGVHVAAGLCERGEDDRFFNSMVLISPAGDVAAVHRKAHLFEDERRHFEPGDRFEVVSTELGEIGLSICYDSRFPEASRAQALAGAEILICIFAYAPDAGVPADILTHRAIIRAWENSVFYVLCNRLGTEAGTTFVGRSVVTGPTGRIETERHAGELPVIRARLTSQALTEARAQTRLDRDRRPDIYGDLTPLEGVRA